MKIDCKPTNTVSRAALAKQDRGIPLRKAIAMSVNKPATVKVGR